MRVHLYIRGVYWKDLEVKPEIARKGELSVPVLLKAPPNWTNKLTDVNLLDPSTVIFKPFLNDCFTWHTEDPEALKLLQDLNPERL